mgnify:CR=1 FL=1
MVESLIYAPPLVFISYIGWGNCIPLEDHYCVWEMRHGNSKLLSERWIIMVEGETHNHEHMSTVISQRPLFSKKLPIKSYKSLTWQGLNLGSLNFMEREREREIGKQCRAHMYIPNTKFHMIIWYCVKLGKLPLDWKRKIEILVFR